MTERSYSGAAERNYSKGTQSSYGKDAQRSYSGGAERNYSKGAQNSYGKGTQGSYSKFDTRALGALGERLARELFEEKGFTIVAQNYRRPIGEIDLICQRGKLLVFCEVKSRRSLIFGIPAEAVNAGKIRHIRKVASWFLSQKMRVYRLYDDFDMRFDVVEAIFVGDEYELTHVEDAFR